VAAENRIAVLLKIEGRVQGVSYRASSQKKAQELGVFGWVRNLPSGEVEAHAEGSPAAVDAFVAWCHRGPLLAQVSHVYTSQTAPEGFTSFQVR
jgi:acylphosphatase